MWPVRELRSGKNQREVTVKARTSARRTRHCTSSRYCRWMTARFASVVFFMPSCVIRLIFRGDPATPLIYRPDGYPS